MQVCFGLMVDDPAGSPPDKAVVGQAVSLCEAADLQAGHQVMGEQAAEEHRFALVGRDGHQLQQQAKRLT